MGLQRLNWMVKSSHYEERRRCVGMPTEGMAE
ncbi:hypothetical protein TNCT_658481, partial [Trichonephila clavata]